MARTIRTKIYKFEELTPAAQENAIDTYRNRSYREYAWQDENTDTLKAFCYLFGINTNRGIDSPRFDLDSDVLDLSGQRLATYIWNNYRTSLYKGKYYYAKTKSRHSRITLEHSCVLTGYCMDDDILNPIYAFLAKPDNRDFKTLLIDCLESWEYAVRADQDYQDSDLAIKDTIIANEYEFTKDGKQYY